MVYTKTEYKTFPVNNISPAGEIYGLDPLILDKLHHLLINMVIDKPNVFVMVFTLSFPSHLPFANDNNCIGTFNDSLRAHFARVRSADGHKVEARSIWVREQDSSNNQHYHVVLLLDGQYVRNVRPKRGFKVLQKIEELWYKQVGVYCNQHLVYLHQPKNDLYNSGGVMISRPALNAGIRNAVNINDVHYWISYFAKTRTKENNYYKGKTFGGFNLKTAPYDPILIDPVIPNF